MAQDELRELAEDLASGEISETRGAEAGELRKIEFLHEPEIWMTVSGLLGVDVEARTHLNDPSEELTLAEVYLVRKDQSIPSVEARIGTVCWSVAAQWRGTEPVPAPSTATIRGIRSAV